LEDIKEIDSAVTGELATAAASVAGGDGADAAAVAACKADAALPVASEPSVSARFMRALPASGADPAPAASAASAAGGVCTAAGEDVCDSARLLPEVTAGVPADRGPSRTDAEPEFVSVPAARAGTASDSDFGGAAAVVAAAVAAAGRALLID
jgi:hypothetical protein